MNILMLITVMLVSVYIHFLIYKKEKELLKNNQDFFKSLNIDIIDLKNHLEEINENIKK